MADISININKTIKDLTNYMNNNPQEAGRLSKHVNDHALYVITSELDAVRCKYADVKLVAGITRALIEKKIKKFPEEYKHLLDI